LQLTDGKRARLVNPTSACMFRRDAAAQEIPGDYSMIVAIPTIRAQAPPLAMAANSAVS
jgi:hypothetical protein